jgi:ABC-type multidrug transport system permease subunit
MYASTPHTSNAGHGDLRLWLNRVVALFRAEVSIWLRRPRHLVLTIALSTVFLVVTNHLLVVWLSSNVHIGVWTDDERVARSLTHHFSEVGLRVALCDTEAEGEADLARGATVGLMCATGPEPRTLRIVFSGRNPLLDRELAGLMLSAAADIADSETADVGITIENSRYGPQDLSAFMAAGTLPFLILLLMGVFSGVAWVSDWERKTLQQFLVTPAPRITLVVARAGAAMLYTLAILVGALLIGRPFVTWNWPGNLPLWCAVIAVQALAGCGVYFAIAAVCRTQMLFNDFAYISGCILMFVSGTLVPVETMPQWERLLAYVTPTFYAVRTMRAAFAGTPVWIGDLGILAAWGLAGFLVGYVVLLHSTLHSK